VVAVLPPQTIVSGEPLIIDIGTITDDPDGDVDLVYTSDDLPPGLTIDPVTGVISGTPTVPADEPYVITIKVDDGEGGVTLATVSLAVLDDGYIAPPTDGPAISGLPNPFTDVDILSRNARYGADMQRGRLFDGDMEASLREQLDISNPDFWGGVVTANIGEYGDCAFVAVEAVAYDHAVYVSLNETISQVCGVKVVSWDVDYERANAGLPSWIDHLNGDSELILNRTVEDHTATLYIKALLDDGRTAHVTVRIDMATGAVEQVGESYARAATLSEQMQLSAKAETASHDSLLMALAG
jgi:hypothetical protein